MTPAQDIDRICDEFEAAWQSGQSPDVDAYLVKIEEPHRPALLAALMPLDLTYRGKLGETVDSGKVAEPARAFDVTLDSDTNGPTLLASSATNTVKYFGEYELLSEIARGGMGVVYKARQVKLNRIVALKMILSGEFAGSEAVQRFHSEAEAAANLDHPGIVPIYEIGEHGGQHYFSMGFIDGPSLQGKLNAGPMPAKEAARLCRKIAEAVAYAHSKNVIHRDLKPANVLIDGNGEPKVTDFGLAKKVEGDSGLTRTGAVMGTPSYMPPEQALGQTDKIGPAADVYSLGAILYCMLTGRPPFQAASVVDTLKQVVDNEPVTPRTLDSKIPLDLETICLKCLEKTQPKRYASAEDLVEDLSRYLDGRPITARPVSQTEQAWRWCRRHPAVASAMLAVVALLMVSIGAGFWINAERTKAITLRGLADQKTAEVITEKSRADMEKDIAKQEAEKARQAESTAVASQQQTEATLARSNFVLANARWQQNRAGDAQGILQQIPRQHRNIEWYLSQREFSGSDITLYGHTHVVLSVAFSPEGTRLASGSYDGTIKLWDAVTGSELNTLRGHIDGVTSVTFSPNGDYLASASYDQTAKLWDPATGRELNTMKGHTNVVNSVAFSPDGSRIASGSFDNTIKIWETTTGSNLTTLKADSEEFEEFEMITGVTFSPDGARLASGSIFGFIRIWDVATGKEINTIKGSITGVTRLAFSPDGVRLGTAQKQLPEF